MDSIHYTALYAVKSIGVQQSVSRLHGKTPFRSKMYSFHMEMSCLMHTMCHFDTICKINKQQC